MKRAWHATVLRIGRCGIRCVAALALAWSLGCASANKAGATRVVAAPAPEEKPDGLMPIPEEEWFGKYVGAPTSAFNAEKNRAFADARTAYWDYDAERSATHLKIAKALGGLVEERFHELLLQCYERDDRWAETLPMYAELGIEEKHRPWREYAEKRSRWPRMRVEFAPGSVTLPCELKRGEWVLVDVTVNGMKARVMLDTGASGSWWTNDFAMRAGMVRLGERGTVVDSNSSRAKVDVVSVQELRLGGMTVRDGLAVAGNSFLLSSLIGVDGIVGWDVMQHAQLVFDFPARRVEVSAPAGGVVSEPTLGGRVAPILFARSMAGRPLHLFLDTGATSNTGGVDLYDNDGLIRTKLTTEGFRRRWLPVLTFGMYSIRLKWPRHAGPFAFWLSGYRFETAGATLHAVEELHDGWSYLDGIVGNASFLGGRMTLCGVRRLFQFEPAPRDSDLAHLTAASVPR